MRLWEDGFDHYGGNSSFMLNGVYATNGGSLINSTSATGPYAFWPGQDNVGYLSALRKVLPAATTKMGTALRVYLPQLPSTNDAASVIDFLWAGNNSHISCTIGTNGQLRFRRGGYYGTNGNNASMVLVAESDPIIVANAWQHLEVQIYIHATLGWIRAAVNGIHRFEATGLNTLDTAAAGIGITSVAHHKGFYQFAGFNQADFYIDDLYHYDFTGTPATDTDFCPTTDGTGKATNYIGELQVMLNTASADTAQANFLKSSGTAGWSLINEVPPNDANYVYSLTAGDLSEFSLTDLPPEITYIRGVGIHSRLSKSDAGAAMYRAGMKSVAAVSDAPERPMTVEPTYWYDQVNVDPNSSARWTRTSFNNAWLRIRRTV